MGRSINAGLVPEADKQVVHICVGKRLADTGTTELEKDVIGGNCFCVRLSNIVKNEIG